MSSAQLDYSEAASFADDRNDWLPVNQHVDVDFLGEQVELLELAWPDRYETRIAPHPIHAGEYVLSIRHRD